MMKIDVAKNLKYLAMLFAMLISMDPRAFADLQDDPAEDAATAPQKDNKQSPGLIRDESEKKPQAKPKEEKKPAKPEKDRSSQDRPERPANPSAGSNNANTPIKYRSERLAGQKQGGVLVLEENVVVTQADMKIEADKATLHFDQATNEVIDCVAVGNVKFFRKDPETGNPVTAEGREAVFNNRDRNVILKGDPKLVRGGDVVRGRQILYDLTSGWVKADRVEGVVQPSKQEAGKSTGSKTKKDSEPKKESPTPAADNTEAKESLKP